MFFFLFLFVALLVVGHYFVFQTIRFSFGQRHLFSRRTLWLLTLAIPAFSIGAVLLNHHFSNLFSRGLYLAVGFWLGNLAHLIFFFFGGWLVWFSGKKIGRSLNKRFFFGLAFLALIFSAWGAWQAQQPVIREVEVEIENLPNYWDQKRVVQISDLHLGDALGEKYLDKIISKTNQWSPEAVFITGDLFDGQEEKVEEFSSRLEEIKAPSGIFYVNGNHETYLGMEKVRAALGKTRIRVLENELIQVQGLGILGVSYPNRGEPDRLEEIFRGNQSKIKAFPTILLRHDPGEFELSRRAGIAMQLSGHTHRGQIFPFGWITRLIFKGKDYGFYQWDGFSLYVSSGAGVWGPAVRTSGQNEIVVFKLKKKNFSLKEKKPEETAIKGEEEFLSEEAGLAKKVLPPLDRLEDRLTKKPFGILIRPETSPVQPERFSGYHTGIDLEIFPEEADREVLVKTICPGPLRLKRTADGYGGVAVQECLIEEQSATVIYGHLNLDSVQKEIGQELSAGEVLGFLGEGKSRETDNERKHLHLAIHRGRGINLAGYVADERLLSGWIDPCRFYSCGEN